MWGLAQGHDGLVGRDAERSRVAGVCARARAGRGGALVLVGEAGIGKTALLEHAVHDDCTVLRASGAEFEQELPYAALHQLCLPILGDLDELPARHQEALRVTFGLAAGTPDPFRVGLAILDLVGAAARERPVVCLVDDAQWLDSASSRVLAFVARRIAADPVAVLFAVRSSGPAGGPGELDDLPRLDVAGLGDDAARDLLARRSPFPLDQRVRDRLVAEANGNPLALLELPRAGGFAPPDSSPVATRIERAFLARFVHLPPEARLLLTIASADPTGDPDLLWSAAQACGVDVGRAGADAAAAELAEFGTRIRFCHPLARSAVYRAADAGERRRVHGALADVTAAPDRRAWHRAQATVSPDEDVAADLVRSASRAQARGGVAAAAAFLERAAALSPDVDRRVERTLDAADAHLDAGTTDAAAGLLATIDDVVLDDERRARVDLVRGRIAFTRPDDVTGPELMARAAARLAPLDPQRSRECYLDALELCLLVGRGGGFVREIMATARAGAPPTGALPDGAGPDLLDALIVLATDGHRRAIPLLRTIVNGGREALWARWPALTTMVSSELWDPAGVDALAEWMVSSGREAGSPVLLRLGFAQRATGATLEGDVERALAALAEEAVIADAAGVPPLVYPRVQLAALRGRRAEVDELVTMEGRLTNPHWATALLNNGLRDYPAALEAALRASDHENLFLAGVALPELVEAAVRCRDTVVAGEALDALTERTEASGTAVGLGITAYARGLVTGAEEHYAEAIERLEDTPLLPYRGRAHLLYGEWLRREGRRTDAVEQLRAAHDLLSASGAEAFARRAADELRAAGERVDRPSEPDYEMLTPQEIAVARLVAVGATSNEVAVQLFISKRTVDAHLRNIFRKLGVSSRRQLKDQPAIAS